MKEVILKKTNEDVFLHELDNTHLIGVLFGSNARAIVCKISGDEYATMGSICYRGLLNESFNHKTIGKTIQDLINKIKPEKVLVFDNHKEMYSWLSKQ